MAVLPSVSDLHPVGYVTHC